MSEPIHTVSTPICPNVFSRLKHTEDLHPHRLQVLHTACICQSVHQPVSCLPVKTVSSLSAALWPPRTLNIQLVTLGHIHSLNWLITAFSFFFFLPHVGGVCVCGSLCVWLGKAESSSLRVTHKSQLMLYEAPGLRRESSTLLQNSMSQKLQYDNNSISV